MSHMYTENIATIYNSLDNCKYLTQNDYFNFIYIFTFLFYILGTALISITNRYNNIQNKVHMLANNKKIGKYIAEYIYGDDDECIIEELNEYSDSDDDDDDDDDDDNLDVDPDKDSDSSNHYSDSDTKIKTPSYIFDNMFC